MPSQNLGGSPVELNGIELHFALHGGRGKFDPDFDPCVLRHRQAGSDVRSSFIRSSPNERLAAACACLHLRRYLLPLHCL